MMKPSVVRSLGRQWPPIELIRMCGLLLPFGSLPAGCAVGPGVDAEAGADPGTTISGLSDTGVSPGRRFQPLILGLAVAIWALTHSTGHDSRDPSGLTLAHQPGHSSASGCDLVVNRQLGGIQGSFHEILGRWSQLPPRSFAF